MTPWWGTLIYWVFFGPIGPPWFLADYVLTIGAASGFSVISVVIIHAKDYYSTNTKYMDEKLEQGDDVL